MDWQTLRDWVHCCNEAGCVGLRDKQGRTGPKPRLSPEQEAVTAEWVRRWLSLAEPDVVRWRRADPARVVVARLGVALAERSVGAVLRRVDLWRLVPGRSTPATTFIWPAFD